MGEEAPDGQGPRPAVTLGWRRGRRGGDCASAARWGLEVLRQQEECLQAGPGRRREAKLGGVRAVPGGLRPGTGQGSATAREWSLPRSAVASRSGQNFPGFGRSGRRRLVVASLVPGPVESRVPPAGARTKRARGRAKGSKAATLGSRGSPGRVLPGALLGPGPRGQRAFGGIPLFPLGLFPSQKNGGGHGTGPGTLPPERIFPFPSCCRQRFGPRSGTGFGSSRGKGSGGNLVPWKFAGEGISKHALIGSSMARRIGPFPIVPNSVKGSEGHFPAGGLTPGLFPGGKNLSQSRAGFSKGVEALPGGKDSRGPGKRPKGAREHIVRGEPEFEGAP